MTEEVTKIQTIPSMELRGLENTLAEIKADTERLPGLKKQAEAMIVTDAKTYAEAGNLLVQVRSLSKGVGLKLAPFDQIVKNVSNFLKGERSKFEADAQVVESSLTTKMTEYSRREREAAAAEERRILEERRLAAEKEAEEERQRSIREATERKNEQIAEIKRALKAGEIGKREAARLLKEAGELEEAAKQQAEADAETAKKADVAPVKVQPRVPVVAGTRKTLNWKFRILDPNRIPRQYLMPNETKIGADVRFIKDKAKAEAQIPGIEVYTEDNI